MTGIAPGTAALRRAFAALLLAACLGLAGCAPALVQVLKPDPRDPDRYVTTPAAGRVTVIRGGKALGISTPLALQPGDTIETGPEAAAIIRFPEGHRIILDAETRVRLGSFFVEFGRLLAQVRGLFDVESENVVAGVEGTEFAFEVPRPSRSVAVTVLEGSVVCRSKTGAWPPRRLRPGERLLSNYPNAGLPEQRPASRDELEDIRRWSRKVDAAASPPAAGYCCVGGRVLRSTREECPGQYASSLGLAETFCRRQPESGYCCAGGNVFPSARERCQGSFHTDAGQARRACQPPRQDPAAPAPGRKPYDLRVPAIPAPPVVR